MGPAGPAPVVVQKFGGSSLAGPDALCAVAQRIVARARTGCAMVVVVSAMGESTEKLLAQGRALSAAPPRRELDMLVTAGERVCMALLCIAIDACGGQAISLTGSQSGIITESAHQGARILTVRPRRIEAALARGQIVVVAGYQGVSRDHEVTTLGRGGSDTSAVALTAALGAQACEIYSDVDGVFSADPRLCPQARLLSQIDYTTMQTLADSGACVLNAEAVAFARRAGITILARRSDGEAQLQTVVTAAHEGIPAVPIAPVAVAHLTQVSYVFGPWLPHQAALWAALGACRARVLASDAGGIWIDGTDMGVAMPAPLRAAFAELGLQAKPCGWATVVGNGDMAPWVQASLAALEAARVPVRAVILRATALSLAVSRGGLAQAVAALHALI